MDKDASRKKFAPPPALPPRWLRRLKGWLLWDFEQREGEAKPRKVPYYPNGARRSGKQGSRTDRAHLVTYAEAIAAAERLDKTGVGLAMLKDWGVCALDFDDCILPDGSLPPEIAEIASRTYAEYSPSGKGVRAFVLGNYGNRKARSKPGQYGFETFSTKGFVTFTGNVIYRCKAVDMDDTVASLDDLIQPLHEARFSQQHREEGAVFDPDDPGNFMRMHRKPVDLTNAEVEDLLSRLDPDLSYPAWRDVGFALHHQYDGGEEGFDHWNSWSVGGGKYPDYEYLRYLWEGFGHESREADPITMRTVLKMVRDDAGKLDVSVLLDDTRETIAHADPSSMASPKDYTGKYRIETTADLFNDPPQEWWVKGVIPKSILGMIYGQSGHGKTFAALDLGLSIARGVPWQGHRVEQGRVLYIAAEGRGGIRSRLQAYCKHHGITPADLALFGILRTSLDITKPEVVEELIAAIAAAGGADFIIVDTLAQVTPGINENQSEGMSTAIGNCEAISTALDGAMVFLVHHAGKDLSKGARGWSGVRAAVDVELEVSMPEDAPRVLALTKLKDGRDGLRWGFRLETVDLGVDDDGDPVSSCVPVFSDAPPPRVEEKGRRKVERWSQHESHVNDVMQDIYAGIDDALYTEFVARCVEAWPEPAPGVRDIREPQVKTAIEALIKRGRMRVEHGRIIFLVEG